MTETYKLELNFQNIEGKSKRITIDNPKLGLTEAEIVPAMQAVIDAKIFEKQGIQSYEIIKNARYVRTTVEEVYDAQ